MLTSRLLDPKTAHLHQVENDRVMDHAINRRDGGERILEDTLPLRKHQIGRETDAALLVAVTTLTTILQISIIHSAIHSGDGAPPPAPGPGVSLDSHAQQARRDLRGHPTPLWGHAASAEAVDRSVSSPSLPAGRALVEHDQRPFAA